ncbi:aldose epimerase family protein [Balneatrix alpica]|uniref:Aldose epimerase family protein n=1 Tax=Balneatrix alpica TaxID=75684 RepID=A0ABV5ZC89_9GAMM|nr:aldose epimerase family protein [Balneatrix alpica]
MPDDALLLASPSCRLRVSPWGAALTELQIRDQQGNWQSLCVSLPSLTDYQHNAALVGAVAGPWANRISQGQLTLPEQGPLQLETNAAGHHLHGASAGLHQRLWRVQEQCEDSLTLNTLVPAGAGGYPASIAVYCRYHLSSESPEVQRLSMTLEAEVSAPCPINLTSHSYFNLAGAAAALPQHRLLVEADTFLALDDSGVAQLPRTVHNSPFDLRQAPLLQDCLQQQEAQLTQAGGFDHCWLIAGEGLRRHARLSHPPTGRFLEVYSDQPGLQVYTANFLALPDWGRHSSICLEPQLAPNAPNHAPAQQWLVRPGQRYRHQLYYRFGHQ